MPKRTQLILAMGWPPHVLTRTVPLLSSTSACISAISVFYIVAIDGKLYEVTKLFKLSLSCLQLMLQSYNLNDVYNVTITVTISAGKINVLVIGHKFSTDLFILASGHMQPLHQKCDNWVIKYMHTMHSSRCKLVMPSQPPKLGHWMNCHTRLR